MLGSRRAATTGTPDLAPGDPGAIDSHDRHHHHARVGQDRRPGQPGTTSRAEWGRGGSGHATAAPDGSSWRRPRYCLESITNAPPGPIIRWSILARFPGSARSCRTTHPYRSNWLRSRGVRRPPAPPPPSDGVRAGPEPQFPAGRGGRQPAEDQSHPGRQQAAEDAAGSTHSEDDSDPPGQRPGPARPLNRPLLAPPSPAAAIRSLDAATTLRQSQQLIEPELPRP
jgi:hypothetical protein